MRTPALSLALLTATGGCLAEFPEAGTPAEGARRDMALELDAGEADVSPPDADLSLPDAAPRDANVADMAGHDAERPDTGLADAEIPDTGIADAEIPDAGLFDALPPDAQTSDAQTPDAEIPDAQTPDVGLLDAEVPDAEITDAEITDAEIPDLGQDMGLDPPDLGALDEACTGRDDDLDGHVDEGGVCGPYIERQCTLALGWSDGLSGPYTDWDGQPSDVWSSCPPDSRNNSGSRRCVATVGQGRFRGVEIGGGMDSNDQLGVAFRCQDAVQPALAAWIQSRCAVYLVHGDSNRGPEEGSPLWGPCPEALEGVGPEGYLRCTSSGYDGRFRPMQLVGTVNEDDRFGVAFVCGDLDQPERAAEMQATVEVYFAWGDDDDVLDGDHLDRDTFSGCPDQPRDNEGRARCVSSQGDGRFHMFNIGADEVGDRVGFFTRIISFFSVALRAR